MRALSLALLAFLAAAPLSAEWYVSNAVGIQGDRIDESQVGAHEFVLRVERQDGVENRTLLESGTVVRLTEITRSGTGATERTYKDGVIESVREYDSRGALIREELHTDGKLTEVRRYQYSDGTLVQRSVWDARETLLLSEDYSYWADGTLRAIVSEEPDGRRVEYRYLDERLQEEWHSEGSFLERYQYDDAGRLVKRTLRLSGEVVETESREYWSGDADAALRSVVADDGELRVERRFDEEGRLLERVEYRDDAVVLRRILRYENDELVEEEEREGGRLRLWQYTYLESELQEERYLENGQVVLVTRYETEDPGTTRIETIYRGGEPALRIYYSDQQRVAEEVLRDGQVIRRREFDAEPGADEGGGT